MRDNFDRNQIIKMFYDKGFCLIPVNEQKEALVSWKEFQTIRPTWEQILEWDEKFNNRNFAVMCGHVSNDLVILDFEKIEDAIAFFGNEKFDELKKSTLMVLTPHNGIHIYFKEALKMPRRQTKIFGKEHEVDLLGEGGYALIPGSKIDHSKCKSEKPCNHKSIGEYKIISATTNIITSNDIENKIKERAEELGWEFTIDENEKRQPYKMLTKLLMT